jgi:hypothetical protein
MPRISAEARMAAGFLPGLEPLPVPKGLQPARARAIWVQIVSSRPADYFLPSDEWLLRRFCSLAARAEQVERLTAISALEAPDQRGLERRLVSISASLAGLSAKLRLNPQGRIERHAAVRSAVRSWPPPWYGGRKTSKDDSDLIGGHALRRG